MATSGEIGSNPYRDMPDVMRGALSNPAVNADEHDLYFPKLQTLLPPVGHPFSRDRVKRVLDFGCGPGNFTLELARLYPTAEVMGVDAMESMLPIDSNDSENTSFRVWDGQEPLDEDPFNLVVAKLVLHYLSPPELSRVMSNLASTMSPRGSLVISVPHSMDSRKFVPRESVDLHASAKIQREIGQTGMIGTMWHRDHWLASTLRLLPREYVAVRDEVRNPAGEPKRLNFLFCPRGDRVVTAFKKLRSLGLTSDSPKVLAEMTEELSDELRVTAEYYAAHGNL
jgi:SAM-dependent methyltransferase